MQDRLHSALREINHFITELNCKNNMVTPFLHTYVHKKKGELCSQEEGWKDQVYVL